MSKSRKESFFWTSYSDLMTSLFFVMLLLFVLVFVLFRNKMVEMDENQKKIVQLEASINLLKGEIRTTEAQLNKIKEIEESVKNIDQNYFEYDPDFRRHTLRNIRVSFRQASSNINNIPLAERNRLLDAGRAIKRFVNEAVSRNPEIKYLLIVEGQASRDAYRRNFELSYERALALVKYWKNNGLNFNDNNCELIISGSGTESLFRIQGNEAANQRFVIHIIPKTGEINN